MRTSDFISGLNILLRYYDKPEGFHLCAEHDEIHIAATDHALCDKDLFLLAGMGFIQPGAPVSGDEWEAYDYDPSESWLAYV